MFVLIEMVRQASTEKKKKKETRQAPSALPINDDNRLMACLHLGAGC